MLLFSRSDCEEEEGSTWSLLLSFASRPSSLSSNERELSAPFPQLFQSSGPRTLRRREVRDGSTLVPRRILVLRGREREGGRDAPSSLVNLLPATLLSRRKLALVVPRVYHYELASFFLVDRSKPQSKVLLFNLSEMFEPRFFRSSPPRSSG